MLHWLFTFRTGHIDIVHYLDDFMVMGPSASGACGQALKELVSMFKEFGVPLEPGKTVGPATCMSFLRIEIDTVMGECRLPEDKVQAFSQAIDSALAVAKVTLHQLQVLVGQLNFALRIIPMGRPFSRSIARAMVGLTQKHHHVRLHEGGPESVAQFFEGFQW